MALFHFDETKNKFIADKVLLDFKDDYYKVHLGALSLHNIQTFNLLLEYLVNYHIIEKDTVGYKKVIKILSELI